MCPGTHNSKGERVALRAGFLILSILLGLTVGYITGDGRIFYAAVGAVFGALLSGVMVLAEISLQRLPVPVPVCGGVGLSLGMLLSGMFIVLTKFLESSPIIQVVTLATLLIFPYLGLVLGVRYGKEYDRDNKTVTGLTSTERFCTPKLLDTSVIIDGRIADLCETGFMEGEFIVPQFILQELQHVSDSADTLKRARGRRGLDILNHIQKNNDVAVEIVEDDFPHIKEIDAKLVELGKKLGAKILTNDLNLNKVAELQGVQVLNINELTNALKPIVLPGETMRVFVLKEGKEAGQGVAYLDDGTMVVVDNAKRCIGKNVDVVVTSILQTSAGRMIFTRLQEATDRDVLSFARG